MAARKSTTRKRARHRQKNKHSSASIGKELRNVAARLKRIEAYLIVAQLALDGDAGYDGYIAVLLRSAVGNLLFKQIRAVEDLAAQCDGGPASDRDHEDDPAEDEDTDAAP
jgi:hypothetical protein